MTSVEGVFAAVMWLTTFIAKQLPQQAQAVWLR